jgi:2-polyprenyl-6-methoxyphenol hydroxylase-like FAD-dependent oxidoreductase
MMRRPQLEQVIRQRVFALPNVTLLSVAATGLVADHDGRVGGARVRGGEPVPADLVVDATGRVSRSPDWLEELGFERPVEQELRSFIGYATVEARLPAAALPPGVAGVLAHPHPGNRRGAAVVPADNGVHLIAGLGMMKQDPPRDRERFLAHLEAAPSPIVAEIARKAEFLGEVAVYRIRGSRRRLWESLDRRPEGFLAVGDAVMAFNPLYGQGMSAAACEALVLRDELARDATASAAGRAQLAMRQIIDVIFAQVVATDSGYEGAELVGIEAPSPAAAAAGRVLSQLGTEDPEVALALKRYGHFFDRSALEMPSVAAKARAWAEQRRTVTRNDPAKIPDPIG